MGVVKRDDLQRYYELIFPFDEMHSWLSYGASGDAVTSSASSVAFARREFSFTIGDAYIRPLSYATKEEWAADMLKRVPDKFDIGAIYSVPPREQHSVPKGSYVPVSKEFVIDIDISDYDRIRFCGCKKADVCASCWPLMTCAVRILDHILEHDFGCRHRMWVFSGRRGVHCWVCDPVMRSMPNEARRAVADNLSLISKGDRVDTTTSPHIFFYPTFYITSAVSAIVEDAFVDIFLKDPHMDVFANEANWKHLLDCLKDETLKRTLVDEIFTSKMTAVEKWEETKLEIQKAERKSDKKTAIDSSNSVLLTIMYSFIYPRLDVNVSTHLNHLLKAPFCVHPSTGKVCVPMNASQLDEFDPDAVPTLEKLLIEFENRPKMEESEAANKKRKYAGTALEPYMDVFWDFISALESTHKNQKQEKADKEAADFMHVE